MWHVATVSAFPSPGEARKALAVVDDPVGEYRGVWLTPEPDPLAVHLFADDDDLLKLKEHGYVFHAPGVDGADAVPDGSMLTAVKADLAALGDLSGIPGGCTYEATCLWLADVIDKRGKDDGPGVTAKLAAELTKAMQALTSKGQGDDKPQWGPFADGFSTPT